MKRTLFILPLIILLAACGGKRADAPATEKEHHEEPTDNVVSLTDVQMKTAGIALGTIELKNLKTSIKAAGMLSVPAQNKAFVTSVTNGVIRTLAIQPGSFVRKGQVVATIVNPDVADLQRQLQTVNAEITLNEIELRRQTELVEGNAAPLKNVQRVQTELVTQRATRNALQKQLTTMGISAAGISKGAIVTTLVVTAPISGTISNVTAQIGSNVDASTPLAEIVNNSQLHLDLFVYEKDLPRLHAKQTIHFTLTNNPGREYDAQIYSVGTAFARESKTIPVHAVVKGDKTRLIEGMNITALISIGEAVVPAVPTAAIVNYQGRDYIFVKTDNAVAGPEEGEKKEGAKKTESEKDAAEKAAAGFKRIQVVKGASDIGYTEITLLNNLPPKTIIITKGAFFAMAKMTNVGEE